MGMGGKNLLGYSASVVLKFPVAASAHLRGHFCLQIKSGDGKQV